MFLAVHLKHLSFGNLVLLVGAIRQSQDHCTGRIHMPNLAFYCPDRRDRLGRCGCRNCACETHAWLEIVNGEFLPVDRDGLVVRHHEMLDLAIIGPHDEVDSLNTTQPRRFLPQW